MKYGIAINGKFALINEDENRIRKTITLCMPQYSAAQIKTYDDSEVEQGHDGNWYEKGHAPQRPLEEIKAVIKDHEAGCFGIAFHSRQFFMWTCRVISNHRIKDRKVMFGDQGIFITRELFFKAGMFPALPIMEDYQFSLTLKEMGVKLGIARHRIYTSDRRFPKKVIPQLKVMWKMNRLRKMYRDGVPIETISKLYKDVR